jgi:nitrogen fixation/metabolism regulation signal transduction histidine kinase
MLIILIIGFLSLILVAMVIPARVTFPFKKITDAIRELQECNFDVSIYYNQKDEIGELSLELK